MTQELTKLVENNDNFGGLYEFMDSTDKSEQLIIECERILKTDGSEALTAYITEITDLYKVLENPGINEHPMEKVKKSKTKSKETKANTKKINKIVESLTENKKQIREFQIQHSSLAKQDAAAANKFVSEVYSLMFYRNGRRTKNPLFFEKPKFSKLVLYCFGIMA